jgi:hypothetical protein
MQATDLFGVIMQVSALYATLFGMVISINFAMILAIWYFLHRARLAFRIAAFGFYLVGMLMLVGMLLQQANVKGRALEALQALPPEARAGFIDAYLVNQEGWLFHLVAVFQNLSLWLLVAAVAWLLFAWKGDGGTVRVIEE